MLESSTAGGKLELQKPLPWCSNRARLEDSSRWRACLHTRQHAAPDGLTFLHFLHEARHAFLRGAIYLMCGRSFLRVSLRACVSWPCIRLLSLRLHGCILRMRGWLDRPAS